LGHVAIEIFESGDVGGVAAISAAEFVVLGPEIALDQFCRGEETEDGGVASRKRAMMVQFRGLSLFCGEQACGWKQGAAGGGNAEVLKKGAATDDVVEFFVDGGFNVLILSAPAADRLRPVCDLLYVCTSFERRLFQ
jgi:hypothetical protein